MVFNPLRVSQRILIPFLMALFLMLFGRGPAQAQDQSSQTPDIQQMQKKLEQLEKELAELKQQMNAVSGLSKQAVPGPSVPDTTDTRQGEEHSEEPKQSSSINFYGYVMTDTGYNFGSINPNWFDVERPTQLPAFQGEYGPNGNAFFGVRQTRFGVKTATPTPLGELKTIFEFELFGTGVDAGQTTFRLRHAYGELGHFGAGQTWSPFMDIDVFPNSIEYWGPNGMVFFRNVQVRWTPIQGASNVVIALERPGRQCGRRDLRRSHRSPKRFAAVQVARSERPCSSCQKLGLRPSGRHCSENRLGRLQWISAQSQRKRHWLGGEFNLKC